MATHLFRVTLQYKWPVEGVGRMGPVEVEGWWIGTEKYWRDWEKGMQKMMPGVEVIVSFERFPPGG